MVSFKDDSRTVTYFPVRQVSMLVEHQPDLEDEQVYGLLNEWLAGQEVRINTRSERTTRYQDEEGTATTVVYGELERLSEDEESEIERTLRFIDASNERIQGDPGEQISVRQVAPNWLIASAQSHATVGGPGTDPVPVDDDPNLVARGAGRRPHEFWFENNATVQPPGCLAQLMALLGVRQNAPLAAAASNPVRDAWEKRETAQPLTVYVLDSAPSQQQLDEAVSKWPNHPLLSTLSEWLEIHRYADTFPQTADQFEALSAHDSGYSLYGKSDRDYSDHGLFAAGIIHSIAPRAQIHLVEVLNKYLVGTEEFLNQGIKFALNHGGTRPLIVNASLMLAVPHQKDAPNTSAATRRWVSRSRSKEVFDENNTLALKRGFQAIDRAPGMTIAAAGNDGEGGQHPAARYPASYAMVTGVSALNRGGGLATYSNFADRPETDGLAAFGGDVGDGIVGVYTGGFSGGVDNRTGWARWAGTSFASPVIAGLLALLCGQGAAPSNALNALWNMEAEPTPNPTRTHNIKIRQG